MIRALHWSPGATRAESVSHETLPPADRLAEGECYWIDVSAPTPEEEELVLGRLVEVHKLTREDAAGPCRGEGPDLPKVEEFPDYLFVLTNPLPDGLGADAGVGAARTKPRDQLAAVLTRRVLVTLRSRPLRCVEQAWTRAARHGDTGRRGPDYLLHLVLDGMVDDYGPILDRVGERLDALETTLFRRSNATVLTRLLALKREVAFLRRTLVAEYEVVSRLSRGEFDLIDERERTYYRNVHDHLSLYTSRAEQCHEGITDLMHLHLASTSNRLNEVMKVLTMTSTIILPMTLVVGVYGMNFDELPGAHSPYAFWVTLGLMGAMGVAALGTFAWRGWVRLPLVTRRRRR